MLSIPTELAIEEGKELVNKITSHNLQEIKWILNNSIIHNEDIDQSSKAESLPDFLQKKLSAERQIINQNSNKFKYVLPMFLDKSPLELVNNIKEKLKTFA